MDLHLRGKRVLITGASKGIGAAAAEAFAEEGADVMLAARNGDALKALAEKLRSSHQIGATAHVVDLRKAEDVARLAKEAAEIDILVNNAGDIPGGSIEKIDEATWRHAWELKVFGYINLTRAIYAQMKARGGFVGGMTAVVFQRATGYILEATNSNYTIIFIWCGFAYLLGLLAYHLLAPKLEPVKIGRA